jgi:hypothetical protein
MRPRTEAALAVGALIALVVVAALLGRSGEPVAPEDQRPSTFLTGPGGARALLDALTRLGIGVRRFRERPTRLAQLKSAGRGIFVLLGPTERLSAPETSALVRYSRSSDLLLAGKSAEPVMRCFGYQVEQRFLDSIAAVPPGTRPGPRAPWVSGWLRATHQRTAVDSSRESDVGRASCTVPRLRRVDTLLASAGGRPVALRLWRADMDRRVILAADEELFRNRTLRRTDAGPIVLGLFAGRYDRVVFEEYHHGFGASGSLLRAVLAWSLGTPWGWAVWQAAAVGLLALGFGAIRFGPARSAIVRTRRSALEHVRALALALSAARGHDVAIGALIRGLRRRVVPPAMRARGDALVWLRRLDRSLLGPRAREALATLETLATPGQPSTAVLRAATAVENLWEELRP